MAKVLSQISTIAEAQAYATAGSVDAVKVCPNSADYYDDALMKLLQGGLSQPEAVALLKAADTACHNEAYGPGGKLAAMPPPASATDLSPGEMAAQVSSFVGGSGSTGSGLPWWLILGGVGLGLWLLFGKKKRKK